MEEKGGTRMVSYAFKPDYTPEIPDDESEKLSTTIKFSEVFAAGVRLEASAFSIEAHNAVTVLTNSGLPLIPLYGEGGLCQGGYYPHRFKRVYVSPEKGVPFLSSSEIISLRPKTNNFVSKNYNLKLDRLLPEKWDILISRSGTIGNIGLATETFIGNALSEHVIRLQANKPETAGYVAAFLRSRYGRPQLIQETFGSVVDQIEPQHLSRVQIPDLPPIRRIEIGRLMCKAGELRDEANHLLDEADRLLHERLNLPYLKDIAPRGSASFTTTIKASQLMGRLEGSFHNPEAIAAEKQLAKLPVEITKIGDPRVTKEVRAITKFRTRTYVEKGGIPLLSSKQLFQIDPIKIKRLAKGAHTKDLPEIQLEENMIAVTRSGTIGKVQIIPKYMAAWTASEHATRFIASDDINVGYLYAWLASDYGYCLITRCSYGSVILEVDKEMFSSVLIPLPELPIRNEIGDLVLKANQLRDQAWRNEQEAISKLEKLISSKSNTPMNNQTPTEDFSLANIKFDYNAEPIWELAARLSAKIPNEEWEKLPKDLAQNFDHYQQQQDI
ncbi:restriction endonuclease subunit S [Spirulina sp. 06S082]|uniref:restriction endonuclease subunit S n=1 Tax=Spirulina sp. 06S082 TaxID=3110248 RepID=UPI002B2091FE|nr:restriction endonuclease subunit S [Spirulina sp. 06S082]MEA5467606.1 restriction endonuclease subunit S [Spirulina sp. 06S082]